MVLSRDVNEPIIFQYAPHIAPICLPEVGRDPAPGTLAYVAGWGAILPDDVTGPLISILVPEVKRPSVLQVVNVPIVANDRCESWHKDAGIQVCVSGRIFTKCSAVKALDVENQRT